MRQALIATLFLGACTYSQVSATPVQLPDGSEGYRYTGRANFAYQMQEADAVMAATCAEKGGRPLIVAQQERNIGAGGMITGNTVAMGANRQQDIIFRCVP